MDTLLLDTGLWDLCMDAKGNIAVAASPYALSQDVASACRTFKGEVWYNTTLGIPYLEDILGKFPSLTLVKAQYAAAALTVPGCFNPVVYLSDFTNRVLSGQVQFNTTGGVATASTPTLVAAFSTSFILDTSTLGGHDVL